MNPVKNPRLKGMSKKDLKRMVTEAEDAYIELMRRYGRLQQEFVTNYGRMVAILAAAGPIEVSPEDLEGLPENLTEVRMHQEVVGDPEDMVRRFSIIEDDDAEG